jgi:cob(I)alamin adenosyltransferase
MVYTRRGDEGRTDLSSGERVSKTSERITAAGNLDEVNSLTGLCRSKTSIFQDELAEIQNHLHVLQAEIACRDPEEKIDEEDTQFLESVCDRLQDGLPPLKDFILAGGCEAASMLHHARSVTRRCERRIVELDMEEELRPEVLSYVNRLSDVFFLMARKENHSRSIEEQNPTY